MKKILGIDLGTNSAGWALIEQHFSTSLDESGHRKLSRFELKNSGVRVFPEGVKIEKGVESSKAAERTGYRSGRKLKFRRKLRKYETLKVLIEAGMCPLEMSALENWRNYRDPETNKTETFKHYPKDQDFKDWLQCDRSEGFSPYYLRDRASRGELSNPYHLGRVFYHLAQRRGFLSNRLDTQEESPVERHADELFAMLQDSQHAAELSLQMQEYFAQLPLDEEPELKRLNKFIEKELAEEKDFKQAQLRITRRLESQENLGPVKKAIKELTEAMAAAGCETPGQYYYQIEQQDLSEVPLEELPEKPGKIRDQHMHREEHYLREFQLICEKQGLDEVLKRALKRAIFYQRPLRSQKGAVASCTLEPDKPRCPSSHPVFELYRMLAFINNIKIINNDGEPGALSEQQKKAIYTKFFRISKKTFAFAELRKVLGEHLQYNFADHHTLSGCPTMAAFMNWFGQEWKEEGWKAKSWADICLRPVWQKNLHAALLENHPGASLEKSVAQAVDDIWHVLQSFDSNEMLEKYALEKLGFEEKEAQRFAKTRLTAGYSQLSLKALKKTLPYLIAGDVSSMAITKAKLEDIIKPDIWRDISHRQEISEELAALEAGFGKEQHAARVANNLIKAHKESSNIPLNRPEVISELSTEYEKLLNEVYNDNQQKIRKLESFQKCLKNNAFMAVESKHERIKRLLLDNDRVRNEKALDKLYDPRSMGQFLPQVKDEKTGTWLLNVPAISSVKNPMAMRALYQLKTLINALILEGKIDEHTVIHLEMARQLNDANKRKAIEQYQREREQQKEAARKEIKELYKEACGKEIVPTDTEVLSYELWQEQNKVCIYSGKTLGICDILGATSICDIEHTIPRSQSFDNSRENKTIATRKANRAKGNNIPYNLSDHEGILNRVAQWKENYKQLEKEINGLKPKVSNASTKDQKDRFIQQRHYKRMYYDYWKKKYKNFTHKEVPGGFKNSQLVDTGLITRFARNYLKTYFGMVRCIKGSVTSEFRKNWYREDKSRDNHIHHAIDAIILACITSDRHDAFVRSYRQLEEGDKKQANAIIARSAPWQNFRTDLDKISQKVRISHHTPYNMESPTRKRLRKRGKVQTDKNGQEMWQKGDSARGSLHKETYYGAVIPPGKSEQDLKYVVRKQLADLSSSDVKNIVDDVVKQKVEQAITDGHLIMRAGNLKNKIEQPLWMNKEKRIPIHKVRCYTRISNPLKIKEHRDHKEGSDHSHKHYLMAVNDENYLMALYQAVDSKGKLKRDYELIINIEAAAYYKASNTDKENTTLYPVNKQKGKLLLPFYAVLKKGTMVLIKKDEQEDIFGLSAREQTRRLYKVVGLEGDGRVQMRYHQEAGMDKDLKMASKPDFDGPPEPKLRMGYAGLCIAIEGKDFTLTALGEITRPLP